MTLMMLALRCSRYHAHPYLIAAGTLCRFLFNHVGTFPVSRALECPKLHLTCSALSEICMRLLSLVCYPCCMSHKTSSICSTDL